MDNINWGSVQDEVVRTLQALIRFDTTNPPGNELPLVRWMADVLAREGIAATVLESAPNRGNLVARLPGTGAAEPLLLMSHVDVVPVEPAKWEHPPFGGEIHDGYVWGRGALDMKGIVAQHLTLLRLFKRLADAGIRLKRDLILMAAADEERTGIYGAHWIVDHHPDLVRAEYALNEGGGHVTPIGDALYMSVQTGEKGLARFRLVAHGEPGHASVPRHDSTVLRLAEAVVAVGHARLPAHLTPTVRAYVEAMAAQQPAETAALLRTLAAEESRVDEIIEQLPFDEARKRYLHAITHNTAAPTVLQTGSKVNVYPSEAVARVDARTLPGFGRDELYAELAPHLPDGIDLEFEEENCGPALESALESPLYEAIQAAVAEHAPEVTLVPTILTGATDAKAIVKLGTRVYGFSPARYEPEVDLMQLVHGHNERVSISNLLFGTRVLHDVILRFCGPNA